MMMTMGRERQNRDIGAPPRFRPSTSASRRGTHQIDDIMFLNLVQKDAPIFYVSKDAPWNNRPT